MQGENIFFTFVEDDVYQFLHGKQIAVIRWTKTRVSCLTMKKSRLCTFMMLKVV